MVLMIKKKILFLTVARSDYGILSELVKKFVLNKKFDVTLLITGNQFSKKHGNTYKEIPQLSNLKIIKIKSKIRIKEDNDIGRYISSNLFEVNKLLKKKTFDYLILLGDRFELIPVAISAFFNKIKIAHIHGGETTLGSFDNEIRDVITKFSQLHFTSTEIYKKKVIDLGVQRNKVYNVGSISIDNMKKIQLYKKIQIEKKFKFKFQKKNILAVFHPETLIHKTKTLSNLKIFLKFLKYKKKEYKIIMTGTNNDPGNIEFNKYIVNFCEKNKITYVPSFGYKYFISCFKNIDLMIGNSSSGIIEFPYFNKISIDIGDRQKGRIKPKNVLSSNMDFKSLNEKFKIFETRFKIKKKYHNQYNKKNTIKNIVKIIENHGKN